MSQSAPPGWLYVVLCLLIPLIWGIASAWVFDWWQSRRTQPKSRDTSDDASVDMYHI